MTGKLKVYARIHEPAGHVIYRINREFVKRAPESVEFVDYPKQADIQIVHCLGAGSLTKIWNNRYVLIQHNLLNSDIKSIAVWLGIFNRALLVVSYMNLPLILKTNTFNFHLTQWGVDTSVFRNLAQRRSKAILTTGWSLDEEGIRECYMAIKRTHKTMVNVGDDFQFGNGFSAVSRLTDKELCELYNDCEFVSGLRFKEGFEVSVIEGLACGCRPICFDMPVYRNWFEDLACYVPHYQGSQLSDYIETVLRNKAKPVSNDELERVKKTFDWESIAGQFWKILYEYV
jgi:glycosyltransferase involved in cell wall biosynthesis